MNKEITVDLLAKVLVGDYGYGMDRKIALENEGYDYNAVQDQVDALMGIYVEHLNKRRLITKKQNLFAKATAGIGGSMAGLVVKSILRKQTSEYFDIVIGEASDSGKYLVKGATIGRLSSGNTMIKKVMLGAGIFLITVYVANKVNTYIYDSIAVTFEELNLTKNEIMKNMEEDNE